MFFEYIFSIAAFIVAAHEVNTLVYSLLQGGRFGGLARYSAHSWLFSDILRQAVCGECVPVRSAALVYGGVVAALAHFHGFGSAMACAGLGTVSALAVIAGAAVAFRSVPRYQLDRMRAADLKRVFA